MGLDKRHHKIILIAFVGLSMLTACKTKSEGEQSLRGGDTALQALELFCKNEFTGAVSAARFNYAKQSHAEEMEAEIQGGAPPHLGADPIVIVSTYCIVGVYPEKDGYKGKVIFERLAFTRGSGNDVNNNPNPPREIIPEYSESDETEYNLKKIDGRWFIYEPLAMRVSIAAINKYYFEDAMAFMPQDFWIDPKFSNEQRKNIAKGFNDMGVLMQISMEYLKRLEKQYGNLGGPEHPDKQRQRRVKGGYNGRWDLEVVPVGNE